MGFLALRVPANCRYLPNFKIEEKHENSTFDGDPGRRRFVRCLQQEGRDDHDHHDARAGDDGTRHHDDRRDHAAR